MYVLTNSDHSVAQYPYSVARLRHENPNTSFPRNPGDTLLAEWGVYPVRPAETPLVDELIESVEEIAPVKQADGTWLQQWQVVEKYSAEERDRLLAEREVERERQQRTGLVQQIANRRWQAEVAGIDVGGMHIDTGRDSQALITGATVQAMLDPSYALRWKTPDGFVDLTAEQIIAVANAARGHVQACFNREAELLDALDAGTFTPDMLEQGWP